MLFWLFLLCLPFSTEAQEAERCGWHPEFGAAPVVLRQLDGGCALLFSEAERGPLYLLLHGLNDRADNLARSSLVMELRRAMSVGIIPAGHVLLPNGGGGYWTDWLDGQGQYEALVHDVIAQAAAQKELQPGAVIGISMGAFAALSIGLRHPDQHSFIGAFSPTDLMIATEQEPSRSWYTNVYGSPIHRPYVAARDPRELVLRGAGHSQHIAIVVGDQEEAKFQLGVKRFEHTARAQGLRPRVRTVTGGDHSARLTWGPQSVAWIIDQLAEWASAESPESEN